MAWLDANPERIVELLDLLKDDPSPMVRRSVANNLNELGKLRPDLLMQAAAAWLAEPRVERQASRRTRPAKRREAG